MAGWRGIVSDARTARAKVSKAECNRGRRLQVCVSSFTCKFSLPLMSTGCQGSTIIISVVHFTVDAVNRHLTVRRNLRF